MPSGALGSLLRRGIKRPVLAQCLSADLTDLQIHHLHVGEGEVSPGKTVITHN